MNQYQIVRSIIDATGYRLRLGIMETIAGYQHSDTVLTVTINRVQCQSSRRGLEIRQRGATAYLFTRSDTDSEWEMQEPITVWWSTSELFTSDVRMVEPDQAEWEAMCHRPGTVQSPLDNHGRRVQGY